MSDPCETCGGTGFEIVSREGREYAQACACRRPSAGGPGGDPASLVPDPPALRALHARELRAREPLALRRRSRRPWPSARATRTSAPTRGWGSSSAGTTGWARPTWRWPSCASSSRRKGARGQFWDFHELIREIKSSYDPETKTTELQVLEPVVETDVLLLDDLGAWKMTDWMNDTLFYILNSRYMAKRPTLITTNYQDVTREEAVAADPLRRREFLVERIGQRLRSRLMEMCLVVRLHGSDHRQARQQANQVALRRS